MSTPAPRAGWELRCEPKPSRARHFTPIFGHHRMSNNCWCKPFIQNEQEYTVVMHNEHAHAAPDEWPFATQML
jgi:hypothetical protein